MTAVEQFPRKKSVIMTSDILEEIMTYLGQALLASKVVLVDTLRRRLLALESMLLG